MSALMTCGIDDAFIHMSREEVPLLDGSAARWMQLIGAVGRSESDVKRRYVEVLKPVEWNRDAIHSMRIEPADSVGLELDITIGMSGLGRWNWQGLLTPAVFDEEVAGARTFGRAKYMLPGLFYGLFKGVPIIRGARLWNSAAIVGRWVLGGKRMENEFVCHKIVDLLGDIYLVGAPVLGKITALRPTHVDNFHLMNLLMETPDAWQWIESVEE